MWEILIITSICVGDVPISHLTGTGRESLEDKNSEDGKPSFKKNLYESKLGLPLNHFIESIENERDSPEEKEFEDGASMKQNLYDHMVKVIAKAPITKKYTCYTCEPPDCRQGPPCSNAVQVSLCTAILFKIVTRVLHLELCDCL